MRIELRKLAFLALAAPLAACGTDSGSGTEVESDASADAVDEDIRVRPDVEAPDATDTIEITEPDAEPDAVPDAAPDALPDTGPARCGNGIREVSTGEICDGEDLLPGVDCVSQGFIGGDIACADNCSLDTSGCYMEVCGDGVISGSEDCDGAILGDATCASLGFAPGGDGELVCDECAFDTSACEDSICGNDNVEASFEVCDGAQFGTDSCRERGFFGGELSCAGDCTSVDATGCVPNICGNGTVEGDEVCDGRLTAVTCRDIEVPEDRLPPDEGSGEGSGGGTEGPVYFAGGVLGCAGDCFAIDTAGCIVLEADLGPDADGDGIPDADDNCVDTANPRQLDVDGDGEGNVCDDPVVYDVLVGAAEDNVLVTNGSADLGGLFGGGAPISLPFDLLVESGTASVAFDDAGEARTVAFTFTFAESETTLDLSGALGGGLPIPIPIPLPTELVVTIVDGDVTLDSGASPDGFVTAGSFEDYLGGEITGANSVVGVLFSLTADAGTAGGGAVASSPASIASSSTAISLWDGTYSLSLSETTAVLGQISLGLSLGFPGLDIPIGIDLVGLSGTVNLELAAE